MRLLCTLFLTGRYVAVIGMTLLLGILLGYHYPHFYMRELTLCYRDSGSYHNNRFHKWAQFLTIANALFSGSQKPPKILSKQPFFISMPILCMKEHHCSRLEAQFFKGTDVQFVLNKSEDFICIVTYKSWMVERWNLELLKFKDSSQAGKKSNGHVLESIVYAMKINIIWN